MICYTLLRLLICLQTFDWQQENFPTNLRKNVAIFKSDNVLTPSVIQDMLKMRQTINVLKEESNKTWEDVCLRVPVVGVGDENEEQDFEYGVIADSEYEGFFDDFFSDNSTQVRRKRDLGDLSLVLDRQDYCKSIDRLSKLCYERSILEIWNFDATIINQLSDEQILKDINSANSSNTFGYKTNFDKFLGGITRDESGNIISAEAAMHTWVAEVNEDDVNNGNYGIDPGNGQSVDIPTLSWENIWTEAVLNFSKLSNSTDVFAKAASSFGKVSDENINSDVIWMVLGCCLMFCFVNCNFGKRNLVEQRPLLSFLGLFSIGQSVAIYYGICSILAIPFCPVNSIIPIILLGLGVDDMFVIMSAWEDTEDIDDIKKKAGRTLRHAGVAITVTSLTDVTAFFIGATTQLPALRSFCLYAAVGILAVFLFQTTFFLACLVIDEKRLKANRNGLWWCVKHSESWEPWSCSQKSLLNSTFKFYSEVLMKTPVRITVIVISTFILIVSVYGATKLHREFNPMWFVPKDSYLYKWSDVKTNYFLDDGEPGFIFVSNISFPEDSSKLQILMDRLTENDAVMKTSFWNNQLDLYIKENPEFSDRTMSPELFHDALSVFLFSSSGGDFANGFKFDDKLDCSLPAPNISVLRIPIFLNPTMDANMQHQYLNSVKEIVRNTEVGDYISAWAEVFGTWETNEIVEHELWRNLGLSIVVVGSITLIFLTSIWASLVVMFCVIATLLGVGCSIWAWGLTIDTVSCLTLVLSVGISVDYAVHVAHAFLALRCDRNNSVERAKKSLAKIGPAVFLGGVSTTLAFALLFQSSSHVFQTFFKIFTTSAILGLYWGLVFLPVLLSFVSSCNDEDDEYDEPEEARNGHENHTTISKFRESGVANNSFVPDV